MDDPLKTLNELFNDAVNEKDDDKLFSLITRYFHFIKNTYPLNGIADTLFSSSSSGVLIKNISKLYNAIINHKQFDASVSISHLSVKGSGLISFHTELVNNLNKIRISGKQKIIKETVIIYKNEKKDNTKKQDTIIENGIGYLFLNDRKIRVGPIDDIPFKMAKFLTPFGEAKSINKTFEETNSKRSKFKKEDRLSILEKQDILRTRLKELQKILRSEKPKIRISLIFNENNETVFIQKN